MTILMIDAAILDGYPPGRRPDRNRRPGTGGPGGGWADASQPLRWPLRAIAVALAVTRPRVTFEGLAAGHAIVAEARAGSGGANEHAAAAGGGEKGRRRRFSAVAAVTRRSNDALSCGAAQHHGPTRLHAISPAAAAAAAPSGTPFPVHLRPPTTSAVAAVKIDDDFNRRF